MFASLVALHFAMFATPSLDISNLGSGFSVVGFHSHSLRLFHFPLFPLVCVFKLRGDFGLPVVILLLARFLDFIFYHFLTQAFPGQDTL
ncbi:hypothetical protein IGI04_001806, partial [Brassica rapa subsp. trilocularis]